MLGTVVALMTTTSPALPQAVPAITSAPPPDGVVGNGYLHQFTGTATPLPLAYGVAAGALPPGTVLAPNGFLTGAPTAAGVFGPTTVCMTNVVTTACQTFTIVIHRRVPAILASPSSGGPVGTPVRESASLVGAFLPTGSMTFTLFRDPACGERVFSSTRDVAIAPAVATAVTSADFVPDAPGRYRWTATYSGDPNNEPVATPCGPDNAVAITGNPPPSSTTSTIPPTTTTSTTSTSTTSTTTTSTTSTTIPPTTTTSTTIPPTTTTSTTTSTTIPPTTSTTSSPTTVRPTTTSTSTTAVPPQPTTAAPDVVAGVVRLLMSLFGS